MLLRRIALGLAVTALVVVAALVLVAAVVERSGPRAASGTGAVRHGAPADAPREADREVPASWVRVGVGQAAYAVPPAWSRRPVSERVAYREDGAVIASGRGQAVLSAQGCPVAWAVLADPVRSTNVSGVAEATALAWARGYAGLPIASGLVASGAATTEDGQRGWSRVRIDLGADAGAGAGSGCAGERAELTAVAQQSGADVVALVVARYLDVPGAPPDAAYERVVGSLSAR
ncbi:hypothetical protein [Nocardioides sp.]|uniref:hypothetical protein n=1 Tax=Nocardioides sp. TaxID=35761 RepID=UPI002BCDF843|nr:hypothetical protein [Nocardioides sp.]HSX68374.1 hypothetical protein [Nocardioides sp.]